MRPLPRACRMSRPGPTRAARSCSTSWRPFWPAALATRRTSSTQLRSWTRTSWASRPWPRARSPFATSASSTRFGLMSRSLRACRNLWWDDSTSRPLSGGPLRRGARPAPARDGGRRVGRAPGSRLGAAELAEPSTRRFPHRFAPGVRARIGRNAASSWTQSGSPCVDESNKVRAQARATPGRRGLRPLPRAPRRRDG